MFWLIFTIVGCGSEGAEDLDEDLARMHYDTYRNVEPNELYVRNQSSEANEDIERYSDYYGAFLDDYYDELHTLYDHVDDVDEQSTKESVERMIDLVDEISNRPTPPEYYDLRDVTLGSLVELYRVQEYTNRCSDNGDQDDCDLMRIHAENITEYLRTMEYTYEAKLADYGLVS
ncbi:hypothetical protein HNR44_001060 [Geomicrobium halophilum]|uniref:Uncharacterized protein n=1 Tax=Geomicrobium halophilum TaxID=549000 RepID=A0A841PS44_9BACL|nr:hypothetical protein [Geomicrobium halophilum]MBB6449111.1 hypothetical protein [Geomicrobium halophilum]